MYGEVSLRGKSFGKGGKIVGGSSRAKGRQKKQTGL